MPVDIKGLCSEPEHSGTFCNAGKHGKGPIVFEIYKVLLEAERGLFEIEEL